MKFQAEKLDAKAIIRGYDNQGVLINGSQYKHSVLLGTDFPPCLWPNALPDAFEAEQAQFLMSHCPADTEVLLIGTGPNQRFPNLEVRRLFAEKGWPVDYMTTQAACRTYNILIGEGRKVFAALLLSST